MKVNHVLKVISLGGFLLMGSAMADTTGSTGSISYSWMNVIVNKTPVQPAACPEIDTDIYGAGFKVALQKNFYLGASASGSRWFPNIEMWSSVGIGPVVNSFGILFSDIKTLDELPAEKDKHVPDSYEELKKWKVSDSAYWESQGGVSFYLGAGIAPVDVGVFAVASGGWTNFLQKTGPSRVYVELSRKKIKSISFGVGMGRPNISVEEAFEKSNGFAYEFVLDNQDSIEAFERFMAGDVTKAQDLSKFKNSGVNKISDMSETRSGLSQAFGIATPFIPVLSFKMSSEHSYDHSEENSVWDEETMKDVGAYVKQRNLTLLHAQIREATSFTGGKVTAEAPGLTGRVHNETLYGNFKYSYQSNWGQEKRLRKYISKAKALTGLVEETCARVPSFEDTLGFNQVEVDLNLSDAYVRELIGLNKTNNSGSLLTKIKALALSFQADKSSPDYCVSYNNNRETNDEPCAVTTEDQINGIFSNLENYAQKMNKSFATDRKEFSKNLAKFGQEVWKSPLVFKAFYEKGKICGQEFKFEVSGQRLTRHLVDQKYDFNAACTK